MDNEYDGIIDEGLLDEIIEDDEFEPKNEAKKSESDDAEYSEFADVVKELEYQLKFSEFSRRYIKVKIKGKKYKVIPITEFSKSGSFVLQTEDKKIIQAKRVDIERWKTR